MRRSGWGRRRLVAAALLLAGALLLWLHPHAPSRDLEVKALVAAPVGLLLGSAGLIYPPVVFDPKPELGAIQLWLETGRRPFRVGLLCVVVGLGVGLWLAFGGGP
jgi:hypothetical protein